MVILHIAKITGRLTSGVCVVVPEHVKAQSEFATVGLVNFTDYKPNGITNAFAASDGFSLDRLGESFNKPDIAVFHEVYRPEYIKVAKALRKASIPYVIVPHGCLAKKAQRQKWLKKKLGNIVFSPFLRGAAAFQCLSKSEVKNFVFKKYKKFIGANGTSVAENGKKNFHTDKTNFVYVGRLTPYIKGIDLLLGAIDKEREFFAENNCRLDIYGPNDFGWDDEIRTLIEELNLAALVTLHDKVAGAEKEKILLGADVFVQTSRSEGLPLGVLEALSYGLPVLITEGTNMTEIVSRYGAGFTCETSVDSVAEGIKRAVAERQNFNAVGSAAIKLVKENFDWRVIAKKAVDDYGKIVRREFSEWEK